jgi:hypothetical protein
MALNFANNQSLTAITSLPASISGGALTLLETQTASSSSTIDFTSNIDSTYDAYMFKFYDIHPATDGVNFTFNGSDDTSSHTYDITKTTTAVRYYHDESDTTTLLGYSTGTDIAQGTGDQRLNHGSQLGNVNDENLVGYLHLFNPSDTTFVKHFMAQINMNSFDNYSVGGLTAGYFNTTNAITAIQFSMSSGNIDSGVIKLYGIS